jgi:hypothetical protein
VQRYYQHNEVNKFKAGCRSSTKFDERDPTVWPQIEKHYTIANRLPDVINFYPVIGEQVVEITPIQLARNTVQKRLDNLVSFCARVDSLCEVEHQVKSLIQSTIDSGVSGGLPLYKVSTL